MIDSIKFVPRSVAEDAYRLVLAASYGPTVRIGPHEYAVDHALKEVDPIAYREGLFQFAHDKGFLTEEEDVYYQLEPLVYIELINEYIRYQYDSASDNHPDDYLTYGEWLKDNETAYLELA